MVNFLPPPPGVRVGVEVEEDGVDVVAEEGWQPYGWNHALGRQLL